MPKPLTPRAQVTQPTDKPFRLVPLTQNQVAIVDADDFEWVSKSKWIATWNLPTRSFYAKRRKGRKVVFLHHEILGLKEGERGDHKNRHSLDCRKENLRKATHSQNCMNRARFRNNTSGFTGVSWKKRENKWIAYINRNGQRKWLGYFETAQEAARARDTEAKKLHGEFAHFNFE